MFLGIPKGALAALSLGKNWYSDLDEKLSKRRKLYWKLAEKLGLTILKMLLDSLCGVKSLQDNLPKLLVERSSVRKKYLYHAPEKIFGPADEGLMSNITLHA